MPKYDIGPTGEFPFGKPTDPDDRGGLNVAFRVVKERRVCVLEFGTMLEFVRITLPEVAAMNALFRREITNAFGKLPYNKAELPLRVRIAHGNLVEVTMTERSAGLVANPEVFLALCEVIEDRVAEAGLTLK